MKAKVKKSKNKILLSIGMIVKNEEKHLENCMKALMPLRQQIPSELIIVDTGSTDGTIEIAKKYADKFYQFEWCNDFSAARNYGLKRAEGKWFMSIDADEYFDNDISEIVKFFTYPELYEKYNSASYIIRNYKQNKKDYSDFLGCRMVKLLPGVEFHDAIHEWLPITSPHICFKTVSHHYGYAYKNQKEKNKKIERNMKYLLEEYKKRPENDRVLCHLFSSCKVEDKQKYLDKWLEVSRKNPDSLYRNHCYKSYISLSAYNEDYIKALDLYNEYLEADDVDNSICTIQIYATVALIYYKQENFVKSYEFYEKYFHIYKRYCNNEISLSELRAGDVLGINLCDYQEYMSNAIHCLFKMNMDKEALNLLSEINLSDISLSVFKCYAEMMMDIADKNERFAYISDFYKKTIETDDHDKIILINKLMEEFYCNNPDKSLEFADAVSKINSEDIFVLIMKIVSESEKNTDGICEKIQQIINSIDNWDGGYSEIIYLAMKYKVDVSKAIPLMSYEQTRNCFKNISSAHEDYSEIVLEYADIEKFTSSIKELFWIVSALEMAVISSEELDNSQKHDLYYTFISALSDYVLNIYNPELFNENDVEIMPPLHRFGYYMSCAMIALDNGDKIGYIRCIKIAFKNSEDMKYIVEFLMEEFENELK